MKANNLTIGGTKGHIQEVVHDSIFIRIYNAFKWKMIPNCTGRYTCRDHDTVSHLTPQQLLHACGIDEATIESLSQYRIKFDQTSQKDHIHVIPFHCNHSTGLITYIKFSDDGEVSGFVHTLNSCSGFQRKLDALGVVLTDRLQVSS